MASLAKTSHSMQNIFLRLQSGKVSQVNQQCPYIPRNNIINQAAGQEWHEESAGHLQQLESYVSKTWELVVSDPSYPWSAPEKAQMSLIPWFRPTRWSIWIVASLENRYKGTRNKELVKHQIAEEQSCVMSHVPQAIIDSITALCL